MVDRIGKYVIIWYFCLSTYTEFSELIRRDAVVNKKNTTSTGLGFVCIVFLLLGGGFFATSPKTQSSEQPQQLITETTSKTQPIANPKILKAYTFLLDKANEYTARTGEKMNNVPTVECLKKLQENNIITMEEYETLYNTLSPSVLPFTVIDSHLVFDNSRQEHAIFLHFSDGLPSFLNTQKNVVLFKENFS